MRNSKTPNAGTDFFSRSDCLPISENGGLKDAVLVLKPEFLLSPYNRPEYQLVLCTEDRGRNLSIEFIIDDETTDDYNRSDFIGILKPWRTPDWVNKRMKDRPARRERKLKSALDKAKRDAKAKTKAALLSSGLVSADGYKAIKATPLTKRGEPVYQRSYKEAKGYGGYELQKHTESFIANAECAAYIENVIASKPDNSKFMKAAVEKSLDDYGYRRVFYVLATSVTELADNKNLYLSVPKRIREWADAVLIFSGIVTDEERIPYFTVNCSVSELTGYINAVGEYVRASKKYRDIAEKNLRDFYG